MADLDDPNNLITVHCAARGLPRCADLARIVGGRVLCFDCAQSRQAPE